MPVHAGGVDLDNLVLELQGQVTSRWYQLGSVLGVPEEILNQLLHYTVKDALVEVLDYWLKNHTGQPSWEEIRAAVKKSVEFAG